MVKFASVQGKLRDRKISGRTHPSGRRTGQKHEDHQSTYSNRPSEAEANFIEQPVECNWEYDPANSSACHDNARSKTVPLIKVVSNDGQRV